MNRRHWLFAIAVSTIGVSTAHAADKSIELKPFTALTSDLPGDFEYRKSSAHSIQIQAEPDVLKKIGIQVQDGSLVVTATGSFQTNKPIVLRVSAPSLTAVTMGGAASFSAGSIPAERFTLVGKDSATITIKKLNVRELHSDLAGSSTASITGSAGNQQVKVQESASLEAETLESMSANVEVSGAGDAALNVANNLQVNVSDAGSVSYQGSPTVKQSIQDAGSIEKI